MSSHMAVEKCFEEAEESGSLHINHKGLKSFPICVDDYDLVDVLTVDISRNRFSELPAELLSFVMMERMSCSNNFIKTLPDLSHLNALTYLDVSQNQLQSLPVHLCSLPLKILNASHNKISIIPSEIGLLSKLQLMDLSNNELTNLPSTMGDLSSIRALNIRRNKIVSLPDELSKLKNLAELNFSCNRISMIPPAFRLISSLIELDLTNNPLSSPPAQICLKGRLHIVKYLSLAAQQQEKRWTMPIEKNVIQSPSPTLTMNNNSGGDKFMPIELQMEQGQNSNKNEISRHNTLTNDEEDKLGNEFVDHAANSGPVDEQESVLNTTLTEINPLASPLREKPKLPRKPNSFSVQERKQRMQEKGKLTPQPYQTSTQKRWSESDSQESGTTMSLDRSSVRATFNSTEVPEYEQRTEDDRLDNIAARKEQLLKNKEEILKSKHRLELIKSKTVNWSEPTDQEKKEVLSPNSVNSQSSNDSESVFEGISKRNAPSKPRTSKKLREGASNFTMRRFYDSAKEEFEQLEKLREAIETRLRIKLPDDLPASLSDGIVLCHLINHLRKGTIAIIHVPSSGVPKLTMPKCQMNVDAFLDASRRLGVDRVDLCLPSDILEEKSPAKLCRCVLALLLALGAIPPHITMAKPVTPR